MSNPTASTVVSSKPAYRMGHRVHMIGPIEGYCETFKPWEAPRLTQKGRGFDPKPGHPGSTVVFDTTIDGKSVRMAGEVWSEGPKRGELWVVKDQIAYLVQG